MPDYKAMYYRLFNRVSDTITALQYAQQEGEETMLQSTEEPILLLDKQDKNDNESK